MIVLFNENGGLGEQRGSKQAPAIPLLCSPKGQAVPTLFLGGSAPPQGMHNINNELK